MAHSSTSMPLSVVLVMTVVVSAIAAAPAPPMVGLPGCDRTCGSIRVPYPFGMGSSRCYHSPGFNLTCDRSSHPPRLLLGDGNLEVVNAIQFDSPVVTVRRTSGSGDIEIDADGNGAFSPASDRPYKLSSDNELILTGCNVQATLKNAVNNITISSCSSLCHDGQEIPLSISCRSPVMNSKAGSAYRVHLDWFGANSSNDKRWPTRVLVATSGWFQAQQNSISHMEVWKDSPWSGEMAAPPVRLSWEVPFRFGQGGNNVSSATSPTVDDYWCSDDERRNVCKSNHSMCFKEDVRVCSCQAGYTGNPYITHGCRG